MDGVLLSVTLAILFGAVGVAFSLKGDKANREALRGVFSWRGSERRFAKLVLYSYRLSDFPFGRGIFSFWSFVRATVFSALVFAVLFLVASSVTHGLKQYVINTTVSVFAHWRTADPLQLRSIVLSYTLLAAGLAAESMYVAKSRYLLKRAMRLERPVTMLVLVYAADLMTTLLLFLLITPILLTGFAYLVFPSGLGQVAGEGVKAGIFDGLGSFNGATTTSDAFSLYLNIIGTLSSDIWHQVSDGFAQYHTLKIFAALHTLALGPRAYEVEPVEYFTTTMLLTAFGTTAWTLLCLVCLSTCRALLVSMTKVRNFALYVCDHKEFVGQTVLISVLSFAVLLAIVAMRHL